MIISQKKIRADRTSSSLGSEVATLDDAYTLDLRSAFCSSLTPITQSILSSSFTIVSGNKEGSCDDCKNDKGRLTGALSLKWEKDSCMRTIFGLKTACLFFCTASLWYCRGERVMLIRLRGSGVVLEKVAEYFYYNYKNRNKEDVPDMDIPPELCLELLMAADYLDSKIDFSKGSCAPADHTALA